MPPIQSVSGTWPQLAKKFAWADGHWVVYGTCQNIHVGLLNPLSPDVISGDRMVKMRWRRGSAPEPAWEAYSAPQSPSWTIRREVGKGN